MRKFPWAESQKERTVVKTLQQTGDLQALTLLIFKSSTWNESFLVHFWVIFSLNKSLPPKQLHRLRKGADLTYL